MTIAEATKAPKLKRKERARQNPRKKAATDAIVAIRRIESFVLSKSQLGAYVTALSLQLLATES